MNSENPLKPLIECLLRDHMTSVNVVLASRSTEQEEGLYRLNMHQNLVEVFTQAIVAALSKKISPEPVFRKYDPTYKPDAHEICWMELNDELISPVVEAVSQIDQAELFVPDDNIINGLKFYAIVIQFSSKRAVFFRAYSPKKELSRAGIFCALFRDGQYNAVRESGFLFDEDFDCFAWDGVLYITSVYNTQRIFGVFEEFLKKANGALDAISDKVPIANIDELRKACTSQFQMLAKLNSISRKPYLQQVTLQLLEETITEFGLDVTVQDGKLVFDPHPRKRWLILKLLDDDYLGSKLTGEKYETNSKSRIA